MSTVVIMPGGFHPFHAGHMALYDSARKAFPGAEVFVAATNDTSTRPFPFAIKEKLAKLAGVQPGHFVQVKSPFQAKEITAQFDPEKDRLIFVRSEKDADKPPQAGGVKKNGEPAYLQPLAGQTNIAPFGKHAYMAYLPTVEFGPGMTSATEIRSAWPQLNEKRKTALVMSLYPQTQQNPALAANVVKMLDTAIGSELAESNMLGHVMFKSKPPKLKKIQPAVSRTKDFMKRDFSLSEDELNEFVPGDDNGGDDDDGENFLEATFVIYKGGKRQTGTVRIYPNITVDVEYYLDGKVYIKNNMENVGDYDDFIENAAGYIREIVQLKGDGHHFVEQGVAENQGWAATFTNETNAQNFVGGMTAGYQQRENQPVDEDYIDEKWSQKYKNSINCSNPKGFSQRAHCAGRKK